MFEQKAMLKLGGPYTIRGKTFSLDSWMTLHIAETDISASAPTENAAHQGMLTEYLISDVTFPSPGSILIIIALVKDKEKGKFFNLEV